MSNRVIFLGPLPPPVHGYSAACLRMLEHLRKQASVITLDTGWAGTGKLALAGSLCRRFMLWIRLLYACLSQRPRSFYMGISGGLGQMLDIPFALTAHLFGLRIFIHHHSFAYISRARWYTRALLWCAPGATHLALCDGMGEKLMQIYGLPATQVRVLPNSSLVDFEQEDVPQPSQRHKLTIGFLSNITTAKGIFTFFALVQRAQELNLDIDARIAGPVAQEILADFNAELARTPAARYVGAVHGEAKHRFFCGIDVLVFPSTYANEASPLTVLEAHSYGIPVIANDRGCIASMIRGDGGLVVAQGADFVAGALAFLRKQQPQLTQITHLQASLRDQFRIDREHAGETLGQIVQMICHAEHAG